MSLEKPNETLALYPSNYENLIIKGDFNVGIHKSHIRDFYDTLILKALSLNQRVTKPRKSNLH